MNNQEQISLQQIPPQQPKQTQRIKKYLWIKAFLAILLITIPLMIGVYFLNTRQDTSLSEQSNLSEIKIIPSSSPRVSNVQEPTQDNSTGSNQEFNLKQTQNIPDFSAAFVRNGDIFFMQSPKQPAKKLTSYKHNYSPLLSPDGKYIAYLSVAQEVVGKQESYNTENNIWVTDSYGKNPIKLTSFQKGLFRDAISWSYDSQKIVFREKSKIIVTDIKTGLKRIIFDAKKEENDFGWPMIGDPKWSSESNKIVYARILSEDENNYYPIVYNFDTNDTKEYKQYISKQFNDFIFGQDDNEILSLTNVVPDNRAEYILQKINLQSGHIFLGKKHFDQANLYLSNDKNYLVLNEYIGTGAPGANNQITVISLAKGDEIVYRDTGTYGFAIGWIMRTNDLVIMTRVLKNPMLSDDIDEQNSSVSVIDIKNYTIGTLFTNLSGASVL